MSRPRSERCVECLSAPTSFSALTLLALVGCGGALSPASAADIDRVLDDWHDAAARSDEPRYFDHLTEDSVFLGTDATERWGREAFRAYAHPHFLAGNGWAFRSIRREVTLDPAGRLAWFDEDLETEGLGPARGSGVLRRGEDGTWRIVQYNLALTVPNERFSDVRAVLTQEDGALSP